MELRRREQDDAAGRAEQLDLGVVGKRRLGMRLDPRVDRAAIVEDYVLTERTLEHVLARMVGEEPYRESIEKSTFEALRPKPDTMLGFLDWLETEHGGARAWAEANGMTAEEISAFRSAMIDAE